MAESGFAGFEMLSWWLRFGPSTTTTTSGSISRITAARSLRRLSTVVLPLACAGLSPSARNAAGPLPATKRSFSHSVFQSKSSAP
jgi:hypothetical protein